MVGIVSSNIISPLGSTTNENYHAVLQSKTALALHSRWVKQKPFFASMFSDEQWSEVLVEGMTRFESLIISSIIRTNQKKPVAFCSEKTGLIICTTKANIELLGISNDIVNPGIAAKRIANYLHFCNEPIVVCNACVSGSAGISVAKRLIESKIYDNVFVAGCDVVGQFIVSGFQSLHALSNVACRPFDIDRLGLNLGEASATVLLSSCSELTDDETWFVQRTALRNDAYHITNPSPKGVGSSRAIEYVTRNIERTQLSHINCHGTATMYNDQMEAKAIQSLGLYRTKVNSLKGYFGHTMGAAGILETIISAKASDDEKVIGTKGYNSIGVSVDLDISSKHRHAFGKSFLKMTSGFGGCNSAMLLSKSKCQSEIQSIKLETKHTVSITSDSIEADGHIINTDGSGTLMLTNFYKSRVNDYPKFYKMDILSRLGFIATEILLKLESASYDKKRRGVILFNHSSSCSSDRKFFKTFSSQDNYYPSPSTFVYTLPNIVAGEIAIRNNIQGETSFYILPYRDTSLIDKIINASFLDTDTESAITGWIEAINEEDFEALINLKSRL